MKKFVAILLVLMMALAMVPAMAAATVVTTEDELQAALDAGGNIVLGATIESTKQLVSTKNTTLDLGEYHITNWDTEETIWDEGTKSWSLISVQGGSLTINGTYDNYVDALENDCFALDIRNGASCTINGGWFSGNVHAIYVEEGNLTINDGMFDIYQTQPASYPDPYGYVLNCLDANYNNGTATITVNGGMFDQYDPSNCWAEGAGTDFTGPDAVVTIHEHEEGDGFWSEVTTPVKSVPETGDEATIILWSAMILLAGAALIMMKKKSYNY